MNLNSQLLSKILNITKCLLNQNRIWSGLLKELHITNAYKHYPHLNDSKYLTWYDVCKSSLVTIEMVKQHPEIKWNFSALSVNPNVTFEDVLYFENEFKCNIHLLKHNPNFTWDLVHSYPSSEKLLSSINSSWEMYFISRAKSKSENTKKIDSSHLIKR